MKKNKNNKGFTLVELIVVMAVLAIISAIAVPRFLGVQEQAELDADYATGAMIAKAAELYSVKTGNTVDMTGADLVGADYLSDIEFKSGDFEDYAPVDVKISFNAGAITVTAEKDGIDAKPLYPKTVIP